MKNNFFSKRGQVATEFIFIFIFVLIVVSLGIYVLGQLSLDVNRSEIQKETDNFAQSILNEFELLQEVEGGYERRVVIEDHLLNRYNISINSSYLIIQDLDVSGSEGLPLYYEIAGSYNLTSEMDGNNMVLIITKDYDRNYEGITILN